MAWRGLADPYLILYWRNVSVVPCHLLVYIIAPEHLELVVLQRFRPFSIHPQSTLPLLTTNPRTDPSPSVSNTTSPFSAPVFSYTVFFTISNSKTFTLYSSLLCNPKKKAFIKNVSILKLTAKAGQLPMLLRGPRMRMTPLSSSRTTILI